MGFRGWLRRNLPIVGYLILVAALAWSISSVRSEGQHRRIELARSAKTVVIESCKRDNATREILRGLAAAGIQTAHKYEKEGLFTHQQAVRAIAQNKAAAAKLPTIDCEAEANKIVGGEK